MSVTEDIIQLMLAALLAVLGSYLILKHWQREIRRVGPTNPGEWSGKGIDVTPIKPTLEQVRRNYPQPQRRGVCFHRSLLALARRTVAHLGYFKERGAAANEEKHAH
jgi:hypothetical protein